MTNTVMDLRPLADGRLVYAGSGPVWGVLDSQLRRTAVFAGLPVLDHRNVSGGSFGISNFDAFRLASDDRWLEFRADRNVNGSWQRRLVRSDLAQRRLLLPGAAASGGLAPRPRACLVRAGKHHPHHPGRQAAAAETLRTLPQPGDQRQRQPLRPRQRMGRAAVSIRWPPALASLHSQRRLVGESQR
jgi:hypothetical protein